MSEKTENKEEISENAEDLSIDVKLLVSIFSFITIYPDKIEIHRIIDEMGVLLEVTLEKEDARVVIGREGRTANALRVLLKLLGSKEGAKYNLRINGRDNG